MLLGAAKILQETGGFRFPPSSSAEFDRIRTACLTGLGEAWFQTAWAAGRAMSLEAVIAYALDDNAVE